MMSEDNAKLLLDFILDEKQQSKSYGSGTMQCDVRFVSLLSRFLGNKPFKEMTTSDISTFLQSGEKSKEQDRMHQWIGYYNKKVTIFRKFFKWLTQPNKKRELREMPEVMALISKKKRLEETCYTANDIWRTEHVDVFLRYCPDSRDRAFVAMSAEDTGARPMED
jgi:hypothetical protein